MTIQELTKYIEAAMLMVGIAAIVYALFRDRTTRDIIDQQTKLITLQKDRIAELEHQHLTNAKAISKLEGEVAAYKKIPLESIASSLEKIAESNNAILTAVTTKEVKL